MRWLSRLGQPLMTGEVASTSLLEPEMDERREVPTNRLPVEPLMKAAGLPGTSEFARFLGVSRRTVIRMKKCGLTGWQADELAIKKLGSHPILIWGSAFRDAGLWREASEARGKAA